MHPMARWETGLRPSAHQPAHNSDCSILIAVSLAFATANNSKNENMKTKLITTALGVALGAVTDR